MIENDPSDIFHVRRFGFNFNIEDSSMSKLESPFDMLHCLAVKYNCRVPVLSPGEIQS